MSNLAVLVAPTRTALEALAQVKELTLIQATVRSFDSLVTHKTVEYSENGAIDVGVAGWVGLARE